MATYKKDLAKIQKEKRRNLVGIGLSITGMILARATGCIARND